MRNAAGAFTCRRVPSDVDSGYVPTSEEDEEDVPECPLPGESEEDEEPLGEITSLFCLKKMFKRCFRNLSIRGV